MRTFKDYFELLGLKPETVMAIAMYGILTLVAVAALLR